MERIFDAREQNQLNAHRLKELTHHLRRTYGETISMGQIEITVSRLSAQLAGTKLSDVVEFLQPSHTLTDQETGDTHVIYNTVNVAKALSYYLNNGV